MKKRILAVLSLALLAAAPASAGAAVFDVDDSHSMTVFRVKHLGVGQFWGVFHTVTGTVDYDPKDPRAASVDLAIRADSVFTADAKRDEHLKSPDFFHAKEFPTIAFKSTSVTPKGGKLAVAGKLTIRGVTKDVTAEVETVGSGKDPWGNDRAGWEARITIRRSDFGVSFMPGGLGEEVQLVLAIEGVARK